MLLASGNPKDSGGTLMIRAAARVLGATLFSGTTLTHAPSTRFRHAYLAPAQGVILVNGQRVAAGDGIAAIDEPELTITAVEDAEFILVDAA
jgi:redox-sensitive bicupin YhaK (pirin superfamily)